MPRLTIACPAALVSDANALGAALGMSMADVETYRALAWQDAQGNRYACASLEVTEAWLEGAQRPLARPEWDSAAQIDMAAAARAQAAVVLLTEPAPAAPTDLTAMIWPEGREAIALMGLTAIEPESV